MPRATRSRSKSPARVAAASSAGAARKGRSRSKSPSRKTGASKSKSKSTSPSKRRSSSRSRKSVPAVTTPAATAASSKQAASSKKAATPKPAPAAPSSSKAKSDVKSTPTTRVTSQSSKVLASTPGIRASTRIADKVTSSERVVVQSSRHSVPLTVEKERHIVVVLLHVILLPVFVIWANRICTKESCEVLRVAKIPTLLSQYFDWKSTLVYGGFLVMQLVLMLPPIRATKVGRNKYYCNGMLAVIVTMVTYGVMAYFKCPVTITPPFSTFKFTVLALCLAFLMSLAMYVKSRKAPAYGLSERGNTGNKLYDFYMGRELSPRTGRIDWKQYIFRVGLISWLLVNVSTLYKELMTNKADPNYVICYVTAGQIFFIIDAFWCESHMTVTSTFKHRGVGLEMALGLLVMAPYVNSVSTRYAVLFRPDRRWFQLVGSGFLYCVGYFMYRGSLSQMYTFKTNPAASSKYMSYIQGAGGKRILIGGWWGVVRRPNYLGDLVLQVALTLPCGFSNFYPWIYPLILFVHFATQARIEDRNCRKRYGPAWESYKSNTKYLLIPYLF